MSARLSARSGGSNQNLAPPPNKLSIRCNFHRPSEILGANPPEHVSCISNWMARGAARCAPTATHTHTPIRQGRLSRQTTMPLGVIKNYHASARAARVCVCVDRTEILRCLLWCLLYVAVSNYIREAAKMGIIV